MTFVGHFCWELLISIVCWELLISIVCWELLISIVCWVLLLLRKIFSNKNFYCYGLLGTFDGNLCWELIIEEIFLFDIDYGVLL
jgi:hypothetical protein